MFLEAKSGQHNGNGSNGRAESGSKPKSLEIVWNKDLAVPLNLSFGEKNVVGRKQVEEILLYNYPKWAEEVTIYKAVPEEGAKPVFFLAVEDIEGKPIVLVELEAMTTFDSNGDSVRFSTGFDRNGKNQLLFGALPDGAIFDHPSELDIWDTTLMFFEDGNAALCQSRGKEAPQDLPGMRTPKSHLADIGVQEKLTERERKIAEYTKQLDEVEKQINVLKRSGNNRGKVGNDRLAGLLGAKRSLKVKLQNATSGKKY